MQSRIVGWWLDEKRLPKTHVFLYQAKATRKNIVHIVLLDYNPPTPSHKKFPFAFAFAFPFCHVWLIVAVRTPIVYIKKENTVIKL